MKRFPELDHKAQRGSKPRCHLFTDGTKAEVARRLTTLVHPHGLVSPTCRWSPVGFDDVTELQLHRPNPLIPGEMRADLENWWFEVRGGSGPTWDLVSECTVGGGTGARPGVLLVEAKAHSAELKGESRGKWLVDGATRNSRRNHERIGRAIEDANLGLRSLTGKQVWGLSRDNCYQMANRFAWAWKLASLGTPVVLVYLGFLNANEMSDEGDPFGEHADWVRCVKAHAKGWVPEEVWDRCWTSPDGTALIPRIMSVHQSLTATRMSPR